MNAPAQGLSLVSIIALIRKEIEQSGTEGPKGEDGKQGAKGERGAKGDTGPAGKQGPKGKDGKQGKSGKDGSDGKDGDDGVGIKDINQDIDGVVIVTMTDGETYEIELPLGANTEVHYKTSGGGSSGTVDLAPYVLRPTTKMSGWLAYREDGNKGEWTPVTTDLVTVNPNQFRDINGRFAPTPKELEGIDNQRDVNEFLYGKIQEVGGEHGDFATKDSLANEAEMRRTKDEFLQDQIDSNQSQIDQIQEKGYDDTEIRKEIAEETLAREKAVEAEKWERSLADIGLRDALQEEIDILKQYSFGELDDKINAESNTRRVADQGLQAEINSLAVTLAAESEQREGSDADLQGQIDAISEKGYDDTEIKEGLAAEIVAREEGDEDLQKQIEAEKQERSLADIGLRDSLQANIDSIEVPSIEGLASEEWVTDQIDALEPYDDTGIKQELSDEVAARAEKDADLQDQIDQIQEKGYDDTEIREGLAAEISTREAEDKALQKQIEDEKAERSLADIGLRDGLQAEIDAIEIPSLDGYATEEYVDGAVGAIEFPETDLSDYAKTQYVDDAVEAEKAERSLADIGLKDSLQAEIDAIEIPSLDGYATEEYVDGAIDAIEFPETDLSEYAKTEYVDAGDANLQAQIDSIEIPSIDGLATEEWVTGEIEAIEFPETDLTAYAKTEYVDAGDSNLQEQIDGIEIPSLDGYATEGWVTDQIDAIPETDLSDYYTKTEVDESQKTQDDRITVNEGGIATNLNSIKVEAEAREQEDSHLQAEIDQIALALEALLVQREAGQWQYIGFSGDNIPRNPGEFSLLSDDLSSSENNITINQTDLGGKFHGFGDVAVGDYVEIVDLDKPDEYALFIVDSEPNGTGIVSMNLKLKDKGNNFLVGTTCEIRFFQLNDQDLDLTELDARYLTKKGGKTDGILILGYDEEVTNNEAAAQIGFVKTHVDEAIQRIPPPDLSAYALTEYVDEADLNLQQQIDGIEIPSLDGYATEEYVDNAVGGIEFPETDLSGYYTKQEVNESQQAQDALIADNTSAVEDEAQARAEADTALDAKIDAIEIPSLEGYATEEYVDGLVDEIADALPSDAPQPVDIGPQTLKITGSRPTGSGGEAGKMLCWKAQTGTGGNPFNEIKFVVQDPSVIDFSMNQMWLVQGSVVQKWMSIGGWFTNGNVVHISGPSTEGDDLIDGQPVEMYYSDPTSNFLKAISREESKADDQRLQTQIDELEAYDDAGIKQDLADEVAAREAGDADLQGQIDAIEIPSLDGYATIEYVDDLADSISAILDFDWSDFGNYTFHRASDSIFSGIIQCKVPGGAAHASTIKKLLVNKTNKDGVTHDINAIFKAGNILKLGKEEKGDIGWHMVSNYFKIVDSRVIAPNVELDVEWVGGKDTQLFLNDQISVKEGVAGALDIPETDLTEYAKTAYVDSADEHLQSQIDAIDIPDIPEIPDLSDYVSKTAGDQTMKGPLTISGLGTWKGSRVNLEYVTTASETTILKLGTPENEDNLRVYKDKVSIGSVPILLKTIQGFASGYGTSYEGAYSEPNHIATKKDVDAAINGGEPIDTSSFVQKAGDTMTGTLEAPELKAKNTSPQGNMGKVLVEGWVDGTATAAQILMSNKKYNANSAYGAITWHGQNANGWFSFDHDLDMSDKGVHSVARIRLTGDKEIQEGSTARIKLNSKVEIPRVGNNVDGFTIIGKNSTGNAGKLLSAFHNTSGYDAVNYTGKQNPGSNNLATCKYVDDAVSANQGGAGGSLLSHTERLLHTSNGTNGKQFYFWNENSSPTDAMNYFRRFKWKLPSTHYLSGMAGAGNNMGFLVICNTGGTLLYQCPISRANKDGLYIDLHLDHESHYGTSQLAYGSYFVVHMYSCLREG